MPLKRAFAIVVEVSFSRTLTRHVIASPSCPRPRVLGSVKTVIREALRPAPLVTGFVEDLSSPR